jgi:transcriptional regulator with XRE-family HTH domain
MGMKDFKGFIYHNNLSQKEVMEYLQVSKGYMSLVISGKKKLSEENFRKLIENPHGWDVSMLTESPVVLPDPEPAPAAEVNMIDKLFALLEEKERNNALLLKILLDKEETIKHLTAEIAALKEKRETVANVG